MSTTANRYAQLYRTSVSVRCLACQNESDSIEAHHRHLATSDHADKGEAYE